MQPYRYLTMGAMTITQNLMKLPKKKWFLECEEKRTAKWSWQKKEKSISWPTKRIRCTQPKAQTTSSLKWTKFRHSKSLLAVTCYQFFLWQNKVLYLTRSCTLLWLKGNILLLFSNSTYLAKSKWIYNIISRDSTRQKIN